MLFSNNLFRSILILFLFHIAFSIAATNSLWAADSDFFSDNNPQQSLNNGRLSLFFKLHESPGPDLRMIISKIEMLPDSSDLWVPFLSGTLSLDTANIQNQHFLARSSVPAGTYTKIRITFSDAAINNAGNVTPMVMKGKSVEVPFSSFVSIKAGSSTSAFMLLDRSSSVQGMNTFHAQMRIMPQTVPLNIDLAYVACPEINTVYIIRTDTNEVTGSLGVTGKPSYLALSEALDNELYILTPSDYSVKVLEASSGYQKDRIDLPTAKDPHYMAVNTENKQAYIIDRRGKRLFLLDLNSGVVLNDVLFDNPIQYAVVIPDQDRIAVSSPSTQEVFIVDGQSLRVQETIAVGRGVSGLYNVRDNIYIAETGSNSVAIYDTRSTLLQRSYVGMAPKRFFNSGPFVYVSNSQGGNVSVLMAGQVNAIREIQLGGQPMEIAGSENQRWLYVGDLERKGVSVVDLTSNLIEGFIDLHTVPGEIAVSQ